MFVARKRTPVQLTGDYAVYLFVRLLICVVQAISLETCARGSKSIAWLCWHVFKLRRKVTEENLLIAFPEKTQAERLSLIHI